MTVMNVRVMRVSVRHFLVAMGMRVKFAGWISWRVGMSVMLVVSV